MEEISIASGITNVPFNFELGGKLDYMETKIMYKKFWTECKECFVFEV
jgi:hypothetical protein